MKVPIFWGLIVPAMLRGLAPRWLFEPTLLLAARHPWLTLAGVMSALAIGGFLFATAGVMPLRASSGHWPVTEWFLQYSMRRSISTHSRGIVPPPLQDRSLILRGAGHYDLGCRPCHGSVTTDRPQVARAMLPAPPLLPPVVPSWSDAELFYIVKHGMKFTGMPAWPAQERDDEVWALVAFLRRMPGLDLEEYLALSRGERATTLALGDIGEPAPEIVRDSCARCHGLDGGGRDGVSPVLAGQPVEYLRRALRAYASGRRRSGIMSSVVTGQTTAALDAAAQFYAAVAPPALPQRATAPANLPRGRTIAFGGVPARDIPACVECHGPGAEPRGQAFPRLAGQYADYLEGQLHLLKDGRRGGSEYVPLMHSFVNRMSPADMRDTAVYFASLDPRATVP